MATSPNIFASMAADMIGEAPSTTPADPTPSSAAPSPAPSPAPEASPTPPQPTPAEPTEKVTVTPPVADAPVEEEDDFDVNFDDVPVGTVKEGKDETKDAAPAATAQVEAKTEQEEVDDLHKQIKAGVYKTPEEIEAAFLRTSRGRQQLADFKMLRELAAPPTADGSGGIGFRPTIEQIKDFHNKAAELSELDDQFYSGNPENQTKFWTSWFSKTADGQPHPQGLSAAATIAEGLFQADKAYYKAAANVFLSDAAENFLGLAKEATDKNERAGYLDAARVLTHFVNPDAPLPELPKEFIQTGVMPPAPKPTAAERELAELKAKTASEQKAAQERAVNERKSTITTIRQDLVKADINHAMRFLDPVSKDSPTLVDQAKKNLYYDVIESLKGNKAGRIEYNRLYDKAIQSGQQADIDAAARKFQELARPIIRHLAVNKYYKEYGRHLVSKSSERHQRASEAAQKVGTTATGQPAAQSAEAVLKPQPGESQEQTFKRAFAGILSSSLG